MSCFFFLIAVFDNVGSFSQTYMPNIFKKISQTYIREERFSNLKKITILISHALINQTKLLAYSRFSALSNVFFFVSLESVR